MNNSIKLIAVDMDGTLLRSDKTVDPRTAEDIQTAAEHGIHTVYCTGRGLAEMQDTFRVLPMIRWAVCNSGGVVYDRTGDRIIFRNGVGQPYIQQIVELASRYRAMPHFLTDRESVVSADDIAHMADFHMGIYQPMFEQITRRAADMTMEAALQTSVAKINIYFRSAEDRQAAFDTLKQLPLQVSLSENTTLEMTAPGTNKGTGLERLAEHLSLPLSQIAAVGDNYNDVEMLKTAGLSFAMGNAIDEIKSMCAHVTADNDHNGVGEAIRTILGL